MMYRDEIYDIATKARTESAKSIGDITIQKIKELVMKQAKKGEYYTDLSSINELQSGRLHKEIFEYVYNKLHADSGMKLRSSGGNRDEVIYYIDILKDRQEVN